MCRVGHAYEVGQRVLRHPVRRGLEISPEEEDPYRVEPDLADPSEVALDLVDIEGLPPLLADELKRAVEASEKEVM